jgi:hypothetical protein
MASIQHNSNSIDNNNNINTDTTMTLPSDNNNNNNSNNINTINSNDNNPQSSTTSPNNNNDSNQLLKSHTNENNDANESMQTDDSLDSNNDISDMPSLDSANKNIKLSVNIPNNATNSPQSTNNTTPQSEMQEYTISDNNNNNDNNQQTDNASNDNIPSNTLNTRMPREIIMTIRQATAANSKIKNYRWVRKDTFNPIYSAGPIQAALEAKRQRKVKDLTEPGENEIINQNASLASPNTPGNRGRPKLGKSTSKSSTGTPSPNSNISTKRKTTGVESALEDDIRKKEEMMAALQARLQALRDQAAMLSSSATPPTMEPQFKKRKSVNAAPPKSHTPKTPKPKVPEFNESYTNNNNAAPPSYPYMQSSTSTATTPSGTSSRGRTIKPPARHVVESIQQQLPAHFRRCKTLLDHLYSNKLQQGIFNVPVNHSDTQAPFYAPGYLEVIKSTPMDLGTVKNRLNNFEYMTVDEFAEDVRLVWKNAIAYNPPGNWIHDLAKDLSNQFEYELERIQDINAREQERKAKKAAGIDINTPSTPYSIGTPHTTSGAGTVEAVEQMKNQLFERLANLESKISTKPAAVAAGSNANLVRSREATPLTQREKQMLKDDIFKLPPEKLGPVVDIISKSMPKSQQQNDQDEIEIDIDKLNIPTLRELQEYVRKALAAIRRKQSETAVTKKKANTANIALNKPTSTNQATPMTDANNNATVSSDSDTSDSDSSDEEEDVNATAKDIEQQLQQQQDHEAQQHQQTFETTNVNDMDTNQDNTNNNAPAPAILDVDTANTEVPF